MGKVKKLIYTQATLLIYMSVAKQDKWGRKQANLIFFKTDSI